MDENSEALNRNMKYEIWISLSNEIGSNMKFELDIVHLNQNLAILHDPKKADTSTVNFLVKHDFHTLNCGWKIQIAITLQRNNNDYK